MIIITGPQSTDEERGQLEELSGLLNAGTVSAGDVSWGDVTDLYCLEGWESCPLAVADVKIAELFGLTVTHIAL
ncbi:hypothetical protein [Streptomyces sp. NPDC056291]|uniref:hypothetical protein n=1 Tax=Streptomyces sp. NPDC056291 TaxID=3345772 RepID=UPI0035DE7C16